MLSFVSWRFVWDSQRLLCNSKCPVNWTTKKTSRLWLWISLPHQSTSVPAPSSFSSFSVPALSSFSSFSVPAPSSFSSFSVPEPSSFSSFSVPEPSLSSAIVSSVSAILSFQGSGALRFHGCLFCESCGPRRHRHWESDGHICDSYWSLNKLFMSTIKRCRAFAHANRVSQAERMVKRSRVDFKPGNLWTMLLCLFH